MKKTLAKAIIFAVVVGGICYQSGPVYAGETWNYGKDKIEIIDKDIKGYDGLKDPTVQHTHNAGDYHEGHDEKCEEDADRLYVGDVAKMKDTLVENDKALAKKIEELERTPGPKGDKGDKGDTGATGAKGEKGDKGDKGDTGATGAKGEKGDKGDKGDTGATGAKGDKGEQGIQGEKGDKGDTGATGAKGEKGDKGDKGDTGATGAKGEKGDKGDKGDKGEQGIQGEKGDKGDTGATGAKGKDGADGEDGASIAEGTYKVEKNTVVMPIKYTNGKSAGNVTIDDVASAAQNDRDHAEFREHFSELDHRVDNLGSRVDKVGAGAAALAALHPMDFDPDDKLTFAAGYGNYKGRNAAAVGAFYRPDEKVMLSVGGTFGNGENMVNAGISFSLDRTARVSNSRTAMAKEIVDLRANVANLTALVGQLTAGMGGTIEMDRMKLFPDVPENHWAYEYIGRLAAAGIVEGYPDGMFNGNRMMSRYEFAAMLYRALEKGVKLDHKLVREFEPEMGRIHVARISGADGDRGKIERVRVYGGDNRDHYGSKLK